MKIVIIGGTGLIGSKVITILRERGHEAVPAAPQTGVNTMTGQGLPQVLTAADVVVDVSNAPSFEDEAVMRFFETSTRNILAAEATAGVRHHVVLSIVGVDRTAANSGYSRAKLAQETLIRKDKIPYSIVHATQFFEFLKGIADSATGDGTVHLAPVMFQPIAADDVARTVSNVAMGKPVNGVIEIAGPEPYRLDELVRVELRALKDPREVVADPEARYFGARLSERTLMPSADARLGQVTFESWQQREATKRPSTAQQAAPR